MLKKAKQQVKQETDMAVERNICRPSVILSNRRVPFDIAKIPMPWLIDIVIGSLMSTAQADIDEAVAILSGEMTGRADQAMAERSRPLSHSAASHGAQDDGMVLEEEGVLATADAVPSLESILASASDIFLSSSSSSSSSSMEAKALASNILMGILEGSASLGSSDPVMSLFWMNLVTRLVSLTEFHEENVTPVDVDVHKTESSLTTDTDTDTDTNALSSVKTEEAVAMNDENEMLKDDWMMTMMARMPPLTSTLLQYIVSLSGTPFAQKAYDVGLLWLHYEWVRSGTLSHRHRLTQLYDLMSGLFCETVSKPMESESRATDMASLGSFLTLAPIFTESAVREQLMAFASTPEVAFQLGEEQVTGMLTIARDLLVLRPKVRPLLLPLLMQCLVAPVAVLRQSAIGVCRAGLWRRGPAGAFSFLDMMQEFSIHTLLELPRLMHVGGGGPEHESEGAAAEGGGTEESDMAEATARHVDFYFALCELQPVLLIHLFPVYASVSSAIQKQIRALLDPVLRRIYAENADALFEQVFRSFPVGGESLFLRMLAMVTKTTSVSPALIAIVKEVVEQRSLDARYLLPVLHGLEKASGDWLDVCACRSSHFYCLDDCTVERSHGSLAKVSRPALWQAKGACTGA